MKKKFFLITGGAGFIGSNIANYLHNKGFKVLVFDNVIRGKFLRLNKNIQFIKGDIRNQNDLKKCFKKKINAVIHIAYINGTKYFYTKPEVVLDVATKGLVNIFDLCIRYKRDKTSK